jgi:hypothetical protein
VPLLYRILGDGTPPYKFSKAEVERSKSPVEGRSCANCMRWYMHVASSTGICDYVNGVWAAQEWCEHWTEPWDAARYREYQQR